MIRGQCQYENSRVTHNPVIPPIAVYNTCILCACMCIHVCTCICLLAYLLVYLFITLARVGGGYST